KPMKIPVPPGSVTLLMACQEIHAETETILYQSNRFVFLSIGDELPLFLTSISLRAYGSVAHLELQWPCNAKSSKEAIDLLTGCRGLKKLSIRSLNNPIPKDMMNLLEGLCLESISFQGVMTE